jgi:hypothetical protein
MVEQMKDRLGCGLTTIPITTALTFAIPMVIRYKQCVIERMVKHENGKE